MTSEKAKLNIEDVTVQVVLTTIPQTKIEKFNTNVLECYYQKYRVDSKKYFKNENKDKHFHLHANEIKVCDTELLYNPLRYYMLGTYDIAYIALIDNFKFAQKLFEPKLKDENLIHPHTFQSLNGISIKDKDKSLRKFFHERLTNEKTSDFVGICCLKLNNGFLIGNGQIYFDAVVEIITDILRKKYQDVDFHIVQSFSWYEITLLLFTDVDTKIYDVVKEIRGLEFHNLLVSNKTKDNVIDSSLFKLILESNQKYKIKNANIFSDSQTQIGVNAEIIEAKDKEFEEKFKHKKFNIKTEIELQMRPGHLHLLINENKNIRETYGFDFDNLYISNGKVDYCICGEIDSIKVLRRLYHYPKEFLKHIRKINTRILLKIENNNRSTRDIIEFQEKILNIKNLYLGNKRIKEVDTKLKQLKISRLIRSKINKLLVSYDMGIQDIILLPFFLDFKIFIDKIYNTIQSYDVSKPQRISEIEGVLTEMIDIYHNAYFARMLNNYQFEDMGDGLDLDFNTSIQQLLTGYTALVSDVSKQLYGPYFYSSMVQLEDKDTTSSALSINYASNHLTSPEFIFATLIKELANSYFYVSSLEGIINEIDEIALDINDSFFERIKESNLIVPSYYVIDLIKLVFTFNEDFELFAFWFWTYHLQNTSLYDTSGHFNLSYFENETFRFLLLQKIYNEIYSDSIIYEFPVPELFYFWDGLLNKVNNTVNMYYDKIKDKIIEAHQIIKKRHIDNINNGYTDEQYINDYLDLLYKKNNKDISLLRRNWDNGEVLPLFLDKDKYAYIDQYGGWFFSNTNNLNDYFKNSAIMLQAIWSNAMISKYKFINHLKKKGNE